MEYKEYAYENGEPVDVTKLRAGFMEQKDYQEAHKNLPILCHDIMINYRGGILLVVRDAVPAKDILWCLGGRVLRGMPLEESLRQRVRGGCGLELKDLEMLGIIRHYWTTDPFGHGRGSDTPSILFYGLSEGEIALDKFHKEPKIITPSEYTESFRNSLHPFIRDALDEVMPKLK